MFWVVWIFSISSSNLIDVAIVDEDLSNIFLLQEMFDEIANYQWIGSTIVAETESRSLDIC